MWNVVRNADCVLDNMPSRSPATKARAKAKAGGALSATTTKSVITDAADAALRSGAVPVSRPTRNAGGVVETSVDATLTKQNKKQVEETDSAALADTFLRELQPFTPPPPALRPAATAAAAAEPSPLSTASHALMTTAAATTTTAAADVNEAPPVDGARGGSTAALGRWSSDTVLGVVASVVAKLPADQQQAALAAATQELQAAAKNAKPVARTDRRKAGSPQPSASPTATPRLRINHSTPTTTVSRAATATTGAAAAAAGLMAATMTEPSVIQLVGHAGPPAALPSVPPTLAALPLSPALAEELKQMRLMQFRLQLRESVLCRQVYFPLPLRLVRDGGIDPPATLSPTRLECSSVLLG